MTIFVSILGLGLLIFVHELGHFTASLALGMRPRRFYIGFPPAILKTTRNGIEYGLGAIPLGGFVKIPGMHRPAPVDVDAGLSRALEEAPSLGGAVGRLRNALAAGDHDAAQGLAPGPAASSSRRASCRRRPRPRRGRRSTTSVTHSAPTRTGARRRGSASSRSPPGPVANILLALVLFTGLYMTSVGQGDDDRRRDLARLARAVRGPPAGRPDRLDRAACRCRPRTSRRRSPAPRAGR